MIFFPVTLRHLDMAGKILCSGIVERDFAARHHLGQQQCGKDLGDRTDLEHRVAVQRTAVRGIAAAVGCDPLTGGIKLASDHADALPGLVDTIAQDRAGGIVGCEIAARACREDGACHRSQQKIPTGNHGKYRSREDRLR